MPQPKVIFDEDTHEYSYRRNNYIDAWKLACDNCGYYYWHMTSKDVLPSARRRVAIEAARIYKAMWGKGGELN